MPSDLFDSRLNKSSVGLKDCGDFAVRVRVNSSQTELKLRDLPVLMGKIHQDIVDAAVSVSNIQQESDLLVVLPIEHVKPHFRVKGTLETRVTRAKS